MKMKFVRRHWAIALLAPLALAACSDDSDPTEVQLPAPTGVTVTALSSTSARVTFGAVAGATSYTIERAAGSAAFAQAGTSTTTTFDDTNLLPTTSYRYRVSASSGSRSSGFSSEITVATPSAGPKVATISTDITASRTLFADTTYKLSGFIHVANGATLTIQPGTTIHGDAEVLGSSLFIMRGARIQAVGTASAPIVFTSSRAPGSRAPGDWGGLIIVGNAQSNRTGVVVIVEGTGTNTTTTPPIQYNGGTNDADDSGRLEYVRIEFAGFATATDAELNSLTLAAVGSATRINFVQTLAGLDDSFEWFGGTVDAKNLVSYESGDDHFDMSEGFRGRLQFLIGYQSKLLVPRAGAGSASTDPQGIENDGCNGAGCATQNATPLNTPVVANFTLIGRGDAATISQGGDIGMVLRRGTGGYYVNGVVGRWTRAAISIRDVATQQRITDGDLTLNSILVSESPAIFQTGQQLGVDAAANNLTLTTATTASLFASVPTAPTSTAQIDWTPAPNAAQSTGGMTTFTGKLQTAAGTFVTGTAYRGAADPNGARWWQGWTNYIVN